MLKGSRTGSGKPRSRSLRKVVKQNVDAGQRFVQTLVNRPISADQLAAGDPGEIIGAYIAAGHAQIEADGARKLSKVSMPAAKAAALVEQRLDRLRHRSARTIAWNAETLRIRLGLTEPHLPLSPWTIVALAVFVGVLEAAGLVHLLSLAGLPYAGLLSLILAPTLIVTTKLMFDVALRNIKGANDRFDKMVGWTILAGGTLGMGFTLAGLGYERVTASIPTQLATNMRSSAQLNFGDYASILMPVIVALLGGALLAGFYPSLDAKRYDRAARRGAVWGWLTQRAARRVSRASDTYFAMRTRIATIIANTQLLREQFTASALTEHAAQRTGILMGTAPDQQLDISTALPLDREVCSPQTAAATRWKLSIPNLAKLAGQDPSKLSSPTTTLEQLFDADPMVPGDTVRAATEFLNQIAAEAQAAHDDPAGRIKHFDAIRARADLDALHDETNPKAPRYITGPGGTLTCGCSTLPSPEPSSQPEPFSPDLDKQSPTT